MSKFLDRLERVNRGATTPLGFGAGARPERIPPMALLGTLSGPRKSLQGASTLARIGADGALVTGMDIDAVPKTLAQTLDKIPWGIRVEELNGHQVTQCREKGCDFLAFEPEKALLGALEDEDTGYILYIQPDMEERYLRAIDDLPLDAVLLSMRSLEPPLTLEHLITIGSVRSNLSKYLLLEIPGVLTTAELEGLRDIGIDGLVVDATATSAEELEGLHERLMALPRRPRGRAQKPSAIIPHTGYSPEAPSQDEEEK